jgi:acetyl esterase/lipase
MVKFIDRQVKFVPADTKAAAHSILDVPYGPNKRHLLDIYLPEGDGPFPVLIHLYGGGLYFGEKSSFKLNPTFKFIAEGFAIVSVNYSLTWQSPFPNQVAELHAAIAHLQENATAYQLDANNIQLIGESSGGHLATLAAASWHAGVTLGTPLTDAPLPQINSVIAFYPPTRVDQFQTQFKALRIKPQFPETGEADSFEGQMLQGVPSELPEAVAKANPATYFTDNTPPLLLYAGTQDKVVPFIQSIELADRYRRLANKKHLQAHFVYGAGHNLNDFDTPEIFEEKLAFIKQHQ